MRPNGRKVTKRRVVSRREFTATGPQLVPDQVQAPQLNRLQLLNHFVESYLPPDHREVGFTGERTTPSSWIGLLPACQGRWQLLDVASAALSLAYIGDIYHQETLAREGQRLYGYVLNRMKPVLESNTANGSMVECIVANSMVMAMTEVGGRPSLLALLGCDAEQDLVTRCSSARPRA